MQIKALAIMTLAFLLIVPFNLALQLSKSSFVLALSSTLKAPPIEWIRTYRGLPGHGGCSASFVQQTPEGFMLFGGSNLDVSLIKTNLKGDVVWNKTYPLDAGYEIAEPDHIAGQQTIDEGYVLGGGTRNISAGLADAFLIKTDENGNV